MKKMTLFLLCGSGLGLYGVALFIEQLPPVLAFLGGMFIGITPLINLFLFRTNNPKKSEDSMSGISGAVERILSAKEKSWRIVTSRETSINGQVPVIASRCH